MIQLTEWRMNQDQCKDWMRFTGISEASAGRAIFQILRPAIQALTRFTGDTESQVIAEISGAGNGSDEPLYGLCDHIHMQHLDILKWIHATIEQAKPKYHRVLDYYGKTGELALRIAKDTKCNVVFVDQGSWAEYALVRSKLYRVADKVQIVEASPAYPRPNLDDERFGFISALEVPLSSTPDWIAWVQTHLLPFGFIASKAELDWKKVAKLQPSGFIYQYIPETK